MKVERIGDATLYLGNCLEVLPTLGKVDAVITDPPYGLNFQYGLYEDTRENLRDLVARFMPQAISIANRVVVLPGITQVHLYPQPDWIMSIQWNTTGSFGKYGYTQWMPALLYGPDLKGFGNVNDGVMKTDSMPIGAGDGVGFHRGDEKETHPCPKPENVMRKLISRLSAPGDVVVDPFMGSGTTGAACANLGRKFIGIEMEPRYFEMSCERIAAAYAQGRLFA